MLTPRMKIAGVISFVGAAVAYIAQALASPLVGDLDGRQVVSNAADHSTAMQWTLVLDVPALVLATGAILFLGHLLRAHVSTLGGIAFVLLFVPFLVSLPVITGMDMLASVARDPEVVDAWQGSTFYNVALLTYLVTHVVGFVLAGVVLFRSRAVPRWAAVALAVWPIAETVGYETGKDGVMVAYAIMLAAYVGCALSLGRTAVQPDVETALTTA